MHSHSHMIVPQGPRQTGAELASFHVVEAALQGPSPARRVCIETAHSDQHHSGANRLLQQRYSWRGYRAVSLPVTGTAEHLPLTASRDGTIIGTLTVGFDGQRGLNCDNSFADEVQALRTAGQRLCEFTKLAVEPDAGSCQVLAALFHVAFLAARDLHRVDTVLLEVNPRHVRYYQRMLGASVVGLERTNDRVDAPAVLLAITSAHIRSQIDQAVWPRPATQAVRSLYTQAFNRTEEGAIVERLAAQMAQSRRGAQQRAFTFRLPATTAETGLAA